MMAEDRARAFYDDPRWLEPLEYPRDWVALVAEAFCAVEDDVLERAAQALDEEANNVVSQRTADNLMLAAGIVRSLKSRSGGLK